MSLIQQIPNEMKETFIETAKTLKGHQKRRFMALFQRTPNSGYRRFLFIDARICFA